MFVLKSTYEEEVRERQKAERVFMHLHEQHESLIDKHNRLVEKINEKGAGSDFLNGQPDNRFSKDDIKRLISLCHPDKHQGKEAAKQMTQKLLEIKKTA